MPTSRALFLRIATACVLLTSGSASSADAAWPTAGLPIAQGTGDQTALALHPDGSGGAFVIWRQAVGVPPRMQRITATGEPAAGWPVDGIAFSALNFLQATPDGAGGIIVFFHIPPQLAPNGDRYREFRAWRYASDGALVAGWPAAGVLIHTESYWMFDDLGWQVQSDFQAIPDGSGGAHLTCNYYRLPGDFGHHHAKVTGAGTPGPYYNLFGSSLGINAIAPVSAGDGGLIELQGVFHEGLVARRHSAAGTQTHNRLISNQSFVDHTFKLLKLLPGTDVLASWVLQGQTAVNTLRMTPTLTNASGWSGPVTGGTLDPLCPDGQGGVFARVLTGGGNTIQRVSYATSTPLLQWSIPVLPTFRGGPIVDDGAGGFFNAWSGPGLPGSSSLGATHHLSNGDPGLGWLPTGRELSPSTTGPIYLKRTETNAAFVLWTDRRAGNSDVHLQRLADDAVVPVAASLARAEAQADRVELEWVVTEAPADLSVERRVASGAWSRLGDATLASHERWAFEDRDVRAGDAIAYRLVGRDGPVPGSEAYVRIPTAAVLALRGFVTNPSQGDATVEFSLPDAEAATLELLDVSGRTLERREVGSMGAGQHRVQLAAERALSPGLYFVRLQRAGESRVTRASAIR